MLNLILITMKKGIFKSIGKGILNGFPLIQSIVSNVKGIKNNNDAIVPMDSTKEVEKQKFDVLALLTEATIVVLIIAFMLGKIDMISLEKLILLINGK